MLIKMLLKITLLKLQYCSNLLGKYYTWALIKKTYNIQAEISMFQIYEIFFSRKKTFYTGLWNFRNIMKKTVYWLDVVILEE